MSIIVVVFLMLNSSEDPILDSVALWDWDSIVGLKLWANSIHVAWVSSIVTKLICLQMMNYVIEILH